MQKLLFLSILMNIFVGFAQENATHCSKRKHYSNSHLKSNSLNLAQIAETEKYDVHFYDIDLAMNNTSRTVSGTVGMHGKALVPMTEVLYELFEDYTITDIKLNGVTTTYTRTASAIIVPTNLSAGQSFIIETTYFGTAPNAATNPLGGGGLTNASSQSWGNQVTWTLSEPFSAYEWLACKQSLKDKIDSCDVKITVPSNCMAGSNGLLVNTVDLGSTKRFEWEHRHPIDYYLISIAVAEYIEYNVYANPAGAVDPILIQNFIYNNPSTLPYFQSDIDETVDFLELYSDLYGMYPFADEKYGHCMAPLSGGMEHQTMTTQGFFDAGLTCHELAHQWFGDNVTCGSWADIWINEGFASYSEYLMWENLYSPGQAANDMQGRHDYIMQDPGGSVWVLDSLNEGSIFDGRLVYDKGAAIIHSLRYMVNNDQNFFDGLKNFQVNFAETTAIGLDLKAELEAASGVSLTEFFEQWYFGEGYPTYSAQYYLDGSDLLIRINHTASMPSVTPTFTNPIDVRVLRAGAADTILRLDISTNSDLFVIPNMGNFTNIVQLDYKNWIINQQGSITMNPSVGLEENGLNEEIIVLYPNPTEGIVTIQNDKNQSMELTVFDTKGRIAIHKTITETTQVDLSSFIQGNYLFEVKNSDQKTVRKVIKL